METFAAIFLAATLYSGVSVQGPDPAASQIRKLVPCGGKCRSISGLFRALIAVSAALV